MQPSRLYENSAFGKNIQGTTAQARQENEVNDVFDEVVNGLFPGLSVSDRPSFAFLDIASDL